MKKLSVLFLTVIAAMTASTGAQARLYLLSSSIVVNTSFAPTVTDYGRTYFSVQDYYKLAYAQIDNDAAEYLNTGAATPVLTQLMEIEKELSAQQIGEEAAQALSADELVGMVLARSKSVQN